MRGKKLFKVVMLEEHTYLIDAKTSFDALQLARIHKQNNTVDRMGAWRQEKKVTVRKIS